LASSKPPGTWASALAPGKTAAGERLAKVLAEDQGFDVGAFIDADGSLDLSRDAEIERRLAAGLRAAGALAKIGLDPESFGIDKKLRQVPFPGLASFGDEDADAALFYGRSREIAETLEELRQVRAVGDHRPFVILGASGAGKSSLLRAGIVPRLRREAPAWLPLRAFRPGADPQLISRKRWRGASLISAGSKPTVSSATACSMLGPIAERQNGELTEAGVAALEAVLEIKGSKLRAAADRAAATILISVDQAEEMARAEGDSGDALADYLRAALASASGRWQLAFTIRTDSFAELQNHPRFQDINVRGYDLRAIPVFRFDSVVEEPAKRYGVTVDTSLVDALMDDAPKDDALPLLAFALQRLWRQYAASGALTSDNYRKVGGLKGLIEDAAERSLRGIEPEQDVPLPATPPAKRVDDLGASTFVPALAQVNDQGATIRRVADWTSFNEAQQELLQRFDRWRLVVRKGEAGGGTVEVAHEALFREWTRLKSWLEPERERLDALRSLQVDAATWNRNGRDAAFLNHRDKRLAEAEALAATEGYRKRLGELELNYIEACAVAGRLSRRRAQRVQALVGALIVVMVGVLAAWRYQQSLKEDIYWFTDVRGHVLTAEAERALKPQAPFTECAKDCPEMVVVPAGSFMMGSPNDTGKNSEAFGHVRQALCGR
jgi:hypothetical protein